VKRSAAFYDRLKRAYTRPRIDWPSRFDLAVQAQRTPDDWLLWAEAFQAVRLWQSRLRRGGPAKRPVHWFSKEALLGLGPCSAARETVA
jgi:hypothetical protein